MEISIGVIGAGRIGKLHAENIAHRIGGCKLAGIADLNLAAAKELAAKLGVGKAIANYSELLADKSIDAIAICSSTDTHARIIGEAAKAGKHIFCEKPIDHQLSKIDAALQAVQEHGVKLQIGFNRRFDSNFERVQKAVRAGEIGQPHILKITSRDPAPPPLEYVKVSGGMFLDMTIHDFDMARFVIDSEIEEVFAVGGARVNPEIGKLGDIDTAVITLKFANGTIGTIDNSRQAVYGYDQRIEVFGSKGMIATENRTENRATLLNGEGQHSALPLNFFMERYVESYLKEMQAFVSAIANNTEPVVTGRDGRVPVMIAMAAKRSLDEGKPVKVSEMPASVTA